jgi:NTP pyrophosphatase (non-canonical NTP hydrolase)
MHPLTLSELQDDVVAWANGIAPNRSPKDAVVKLVSETSELLDAVLNRGNVESELGDCLILLLDLSYMYSIDLVDAGTIKMEINRRRSWRSEDGVIRRNGKTNGK